MHRTLVRLFLVVASLEAVSWLGLLIGMYVKYGTEGGERGVQVFGPIHGALFLGYGLLTLLVARRLRWSLRLTLVALVCSIPPFATLVFEWWAVRSGRLQQAATEARRTSVSVTG